ncbi:hypothetical protein PtA15_5A269 [Puccinia triticina]|uniref:Uncharacterized protein n=1 Tax=Puccinia triticina TaxID=208348 RepID=A0ABY7CHI6_9BASI|nr:uncharacterized protein PtA15_5A269 [Puccinia triticina]WAQ84696.1 hypothetical protein PtA15_5A269 [Puccinia triticina]WAR58040.1 hypothetical protein PtB15_5B271 [Puccinia triticina]
MRIPPRISAVFPTCIMKIQDIPPHQMLPPMVITIPLLGPRPQDPTSTLHFPHTAPHIFRLKLLSTHVLSAT